MLFSRTIVAVSAGLFLAVCPQLTLGFGCETSAECTAPETCEAVTIPTRTEGAVVPLQICAEACHADADCSSHCCGDLGVCEVPGETPDVGTGSLCTKDCACTPPEICCAARGVCAEPDNCVTTNCATEVTCNPKSAKPINSGAPCSGGLCNRGQCCVRE